MANKLRDVFSKNDRFLQASIQFVDAHSSEDFKKAIDEVHKNGQTVKVNGIKSMSVSVVSGFGSLPISSSESIIDAVVGPSYEEINLPLEIDSEIVDFPVLRCGIENGCIIKTKDGFFVDTKMVFDENTRTTKVSINPNFDQAPDVTSVMESISIVKAILKKFFPPDLNTESELDLALSHLDGVYRLYERLKFVEDLFEKNFEPASINLNDFDSQRDLYELWLVLKEHRTIRLNAKLNETMDTGITMGSNNPVEVNHKLDIAILSGMEYSLWGEKVLLHCANYLGNAIVKSIENAENGQIRVHYGERESEPMYISYKAFLSEKDACEELNTMMEHKEEYMSAKTVDQYMQE